MKSKNIFNLYGDIIKSAGLRDIGVFMKNFEDYEEIPLIPYYKDVSKLREFYKDQTQDVITAMGYFYMHNIYNYKKTHHPYLNNWRCFLTYNIDHEEDLDEEFLFESNIAIPNFLVTQKPFLFNSITWNKEDVKIQPIIYNTLKNNGIIDSFDYFISKGEFSSCLYMKPLMYSNDE